MHRCHPGSFHHSTRRVSRVFPNDHASPSRIEKPFLHLPNTRVTHHFLPTTSQSVFPVVDQRVKKIHKPARKSCTHKLTDLSPKSERSPLFGATIWVNMAML
jgi:hypothetical protein